MKQKCILIVFVILGIIALAWFLTPGRAKPDLDPIVTKIQTIGIGNILKEADLLIEQKKSELREGGFINISAQDLNAFPHLASLGRDHVIDAFDSPYIKIFINAGFNHPYILKIFPENDHKGPALEMQKGCSYFITNRITLNW